MNRQPIYVLPHGIEVMTELPMTETNRYVRLMIRPHPLFAAKVVGKLQCVRRSRAVMTSKLGRILGEHECVHHKNEDRLDDSPDNLEIISPAEHNRHHKTGYRHREDSKAKTSARMKEAWASGLHANSARRGEDQPGAKLNDDLVRMIRSSDSPAAQIARELRVSSQVVLTARNRKTWRHVV